MALPSGHPQAFREKGLTQTLYLALICADFFTLLIALSYADRRRFFLCLLFL